MSQGYEFEDGYNPRTHIIQNLDLTNNICLPSTSTIETKGVYCQYV
jgi:hypothetical protein